MPTLTCVVSGQWDKKGGRCGRPAVPRLNVCAECRRHVSSTIRELPELYRTCEKILAAPVRASSLERVSGTRRSDLHIDEAVATARTDMTRMLATWSRLVIDEFSPGEDRPRSREIGELTSFLHRHLDLLLAHPAAAEFVEEIDSIAKNARRAASDEPAQSWDLGRCIEDGCDGHITAAIRSDAGFSPYQVRCDAGHSWSPRQWLSLARRIGSPAQWNERGHATT